MKNSTYQSEITANLNTKLFLNALDGITDEQAKERISDHNNPLNWLAAHNIWARYYMCKLLGKPPAKNPYDGYFEGFKPFDPEQQFQTVTELKEEWNKSTKLLKQAFDSVSEEHLDSQCPLNSPIGD